MTAEFWTLAELLRDYHAAIRHPKISKALICPGQDERLRLVFRALLLSDGNWTAAKNDLERRLKGRPDWLKRLEAWAEKVRGKKRVLLLPEKCGGAQ